MIHVGRLFQHDVKEGNYEKIKVNTRYEVFYCLL